MALLSVNGVPLECTASEWEPVRLGEVVRSFNGMPRPTGRVLKRDFRFTTGLLSVEEAQAVRGLVEGAGHLLSFEDASGWLYTSRELAPFATLDVSRATTGARHGEACLTIAAGGSARWHLGTEGYEDGGGTILGWVREGAGPWRHVVHASTGSLYLDGLLVGTGYAFARCLGGTLQLGDFDAQGVATAFDDVVALPYVVPAAWVPFLYAFHAARGWPALPYVLAQGPRFPAAGLRAVGQAGAGRAEALLSAVGESFEFTLYGT